MYDVSTKGMTVLKYLQDYSDEQNPVSTSEIINYCNKQGIEINRHSVPGIISKLISYGYDIIEIKSKSNLYFYGTGNFETSEIKLLIDAVLSAKFISAKETNVLVAKILQLTGKKQKEKLKRHIVTEKRIKSGSNKVNYTIDAINDAISLNRKISFKYKDYNPDKTTSYRHEGYLYVFSPYDLVWYNELYYVVGYSEKHNQIIKFRVDRIDKLNILEEDAILKPKKYNPIEYINMAFSMYDGVNKHIKLKCRPEMMNVIIDRFGKDVSTKQVGNHYFYVEADVAISEKFFGWLFGFPGKIELIGPKEVKEDYINSLLGALNNYGYKEHSK